MGGRFMPAVYTRCGERERRGSGVRGSFGEAIAGALAAVAADDLAARDQFIDEADAGRLRGADLFEDLAESDVGAAADQIEDALLALAAGVVAHVGGGLGRRAHERGARGGELGD